MAATRENVLATIVEYVESNKRRAPAKDIALAVGDTLPNVQAIIKSLVADGAITTSRGRNGGVLPDGVILEKKDKPAKVKAAASNSTAAVDNTPSPELSAQFAALLSQLEGDSQSEAPSEEAAAF